MVSLVSRSMALQSPLSTSVTKSLELISTREIRPKERRPLAIIYSWLMAKKSHIMKYGNLYLGQGFDVLTVNISPLQLLWPTSGSQVMAKEVLDFLIAREFYNPVVVHAFSVGAYMFSEVLVKMQQEERYREVGQRIAGQVYDSCGDYSQIVTGIPKAVTSNPLLQKLVEGYFRFHLKTFYNSATQHYIRGSDQFHNTFVKAPSLFLFSKDDLTGNADANFKVIEEWKALGIKVHYHCWDSSPHVGHMHRHPEEYVSEIATFLKQIGLQNDQLKLQKQSSKL